jgi:hypothetical protein
LRPNCRIDDFPVDTQARTRITQFAYNYANLLNSLHHVFNGHPGQIDTAIGLMYDLRILSASLMQTLDPANPSLHVGPSFEYVHVQRGM